jgi:hypothetical protein
MPRWNQKTRRNHEQDLCEEFPGATQGIDEAWKTLRDDYMPPHEIARAVAMANDLQPDISFVTGDFVSSEGDPLDACITELSRLRAPLCVWGCNGNHEIYAGVGRRRGTPPP